MRPAGPARRSAVALALLPVLAACGGTAVPAATTPAGTAATASASASAGTTGPTPSAPATTTASPSADTTQCRTALRITVKGATVTPAPATTDVAAGCEVDLTITSDRSNEVHVHVADLEEPITAGTPLRVTFTPEQPGVYEVELHEPQLLLVKLAVR